MLFSPYFHPPSSTPSFIIQELHDLIIFLIIPIFLILIYYLFLPTSSFYPLPSLEFY